jgi:hypothetical protein
MGYKIGSEIVIDGLVFCVDALDTTSYSSGSTNWNDLVNSNIGTANNAPTFNSNGYIGFDSGGDEFNFTTNPLHSNSVTKFTVSTWFNCTLSDMNNSLGIFITTAPGADPSGGGFWIGYDDRNATHSPVEGIAWNCKTAAGFQRGKSNNNVISNNTWHNVTLVLDSQVTLYVDGVSSTNRTQDASGNYTTRDNEFTIGATDTSGFEYKGLLSNVIVYNKALAVDEVLQNFNAHKSRFGL